MANRALYLSLFGWVVAGCSSSPPLEQSASFNLPNVVNGRLAVGGVSAASGPIAESARQSYSSLLRRALVEQREDYPVLPAEEVQERLGVMYGPIERELQNKGELGEVSLAVLRKELADSRYIAFVRIDNNEVVRDRSETADKDSSGTVIEGSRKVIATANRNITASLTIYDLRLGEVAWRGTVSKKLGSSKQYDKEHEYTLTSVLNALQGKAAAVLDRKYPYPQAPGTEQVLTKVFEGFGERLPH